MPEQRGWRFLEWLGRFETIHLLLTSDFVRTLLWPTVATVIGAAAGWTQGVPIMWIMVGSALIFMSITQSLLRADEYRERKNPLNKLSVTGVIFSCDLIPAPMPQPIPVGNRKQRLAAAASQTKSEPQMIPFNQVVVGVKRQIDGGQVGIQIKNTATFPISCILQAAETEVAGLKPPRSNFPRAPSTIQPGVTAHISDDRISMNGHSCGRLGGKMDVIIRYGLRGKEHCELALKADLDIMIEDFGLVTNVFAAWKN